VVSTGGQTPAFGFQSPGDYAAYNSNQTPDGTQVSAATSTALPSDEIGEVATNAYIYAYPLILMELTRRIATNVADTRQFSKAPMNQFANLPAFPDATFTDVVRANVDTLYSLMWFDVSKEPLLISVPVSGGRYYLLPMLEMWTDVFQSTGKRTTGTSAQVLAIAEPRWQGQLPAGAMLVHSSTAIGDDHAGRSKRERSPDRRANHWRVPGRSQYDCLCRAHRARIRWLYATADLRRPSIDSRIGSKQRVPPRSGEWPVWALSGG
jgi:hypothetical protein